MAMGYQPRFSISSAYLKSAEAIQRLQTLIETAPIQVPWAAALERDALAQSAHGTAAIEGNPLSLNEVKTLMDGKPLTHAPPRAVYDIRNVLELLRDVERKALSPSGLCEADIHEFHRILGRQNTLERDPVGKYRNYGVEVGDHKGTHPNDIPKRMADLIEWVQGEGQQWPPLVTSAVLHFRFEFIHPYGDGNGRVGRAWMLAELYRRQFKTRHVFSIEEILWEKRWDYFAALQSAGIHPEQDLTHWLEFSAEALHLALERAWARIERLPASPEADDLMLTPNQERLLELLREKPLGIAAIQKALRVTKPGAHHILKPLMNIHLIERIGGHKTGKYRLRLPKPKIEV